MGMIEAKTFTTGAEIYANAKAVRERMLNPVNNVKLLKELQDEKRSLQAEIQELKAIIDESRMIISDLEAAVLCQAHILIETYQKNDNEIGKLGRRSPRAICEKVLEQDFPHVSFADVIGPKRNRELLPARHACIAAVYKERDDMSYPQIGRVFKRDHTTIIHALQKIGACQKQEVRA